MVRCFAIMGCEYYLKRKVKCMHFIIVVILFQSAISGCYANELVEMLEDSPSNKQSRDISTTTETIRRISPSGRIFLLSHENKGFRKGDFISLVLYDKLVARALVAKTKGGFAGIKILKIYSLPLWNELGPNKQVKIVRGDDSFYHNKKKRKAGELASKENRITDSDFGDEDDMTEDEKMLFGDVSIEKDKKRVIKTDNLLSLSYGFIASADVDAEAVNYTHLSGSYAYQVASNIWVEGAYGRTVANSFPSDEQTTTIDRAIFRLKYAFKAPFYSFVMPYVGYQITSAKNEGEDANKTTDVTNKEIAALDAAEKTGFIVGVTLLKRMVPGWFLRADLGIDFMGGGLVVEF